MQCDSSWLDVLTGRVPLRSLNAQGEVDRSSSYGEKTQVAIANLHQADDGTVSLAYGLTRKSKVTLEWWRSTVNPTDIFRLSKILGHSSVVVTQKVYAHLAPEAWEQDYHRLAFTLPSDGTVYGLTRRKPANEEEKPQLRAV
jgi:hypothetical protein